MTKLYFAASPIETELVLLLLLWWISENIWIFRNLRHTTESRENETKM